MKSLHQPKQQPASSQTQSANSQPIGSRSGLSFWMPFMSNSPVPPQSFASQTMYNVVDKCRIVGDFPHAEGRHTNARQGDEATVTGIQFDETDIEIVPFPQRRQGIRVRYPTGKIDNGSLRVQLLKQKYIRRKQMALKSHKIRLIRDRLAVQVRALSDAIGRNQMEIKDNTEDSTRDRGIVTNLATDTPDFLRA
ncbi:hypothetical protein POJ06DRAFT_89947 [Lipomyces tetrasporus]|uniref:Uncharacterized protein n=1 Tax=Lipomyces tetrasporus TaxID=54092 RepID=A0AAD7QTM3_9ASCO|nr:uncharacterized protein POJ06DRAFT_89947 [Lipomyces tetrasporus]KAJ8101160.1 hypothetical protein POJ06DRAFT_89947 [Lipomyces tetrasporus]